MALGTIVAVLQMQERMFCVMKLSLCWALLLCRDLERRSSGVDVGTLHPGAAAGFSVM